jgi:hypothetical protein
MNDKINRSEKEFEKIQYPDEINKLRMDIIKYFTFRFQNQV